jgi:hypothetical protein
MIPKLLKLLFPLKMLKVLVGCFLCISFFISCGNIEQTNIPVKKEVKEYHIECDSLELNSIYNSFKENKYIQIKISYNGESRVARMRIRGDTSRKDPKKSLKIKFDSLGLKSVPKIVNLNAEYADKTYIRQYLSSKLMQKSGQICFDSEHVKVFINGSFYGIYLQVENMDKDFLKRNHLSKKGNLYKATKDGACLSVFDDFESKWEKKTNKKSDHNDLLKLIESINSVPDNEFHDFVIKTFEYDKLINILALNMLLSNSSTYYHNYYLYHDLYDTGKWQMIPWDLDKTMSYYNWMPYTYHRTSSEWESDNPLVERAILCKPMFADIQNRINELYNSGLNNISLNPIIDSLVSELEPIIPLDNTDKIESVNEWKTYANNEKSYFDKHYKLLQKQFNKQPLSFKVYRFHKTQTDVITYKWERAIHPANKKISYVLSYGSDFLLTDSSKTTYITNVSDTFFTMKKRLPEGKYYWKITAYDGEYYTDGFNTKNILEVKRGTELPPIISKDMVLKKTNSPYIIPTTTTIKKGVILTLEEGVEVHLKENVTVQCYGSIIANGTKENPILFIPDNTADAWGFIYFYQTKQPSYLKNVVLKDGTINSKSDDLTIHNSTIKIDKKFMGDGYSKREVLIYSGGKKIHIKNSIFKGNGEGEGLVFFYGEAITENSYFENVPDAIEYIQINKGVIRNNLVITSPDDAIDLNACNNILIENNILINNKDKGISIGTEQYGPSVKNIQINNNLIIGNKTAIAIKDSSIAYMSNNTLFKNISGINAYKKREDYNIGGKGFIKNTIFEKNEKTNAYPDKWSSLTVNNSIVNNKVLAGKNNFKGDPKFIDAKRNNFHLRKESLCIKKGDDKEDIGAFNSKGTTISFSKVHLASNKNGGNWLELINNYNIDVDLSLYKIIIQTGEKKKEFIFPIGTILSRLDSIVIANQYLVFLQKQSAFKNIIGGLPKIKETVSSIKLVNPDGYLIDSYTLSSQSIKKENITFVSNRVNDKSKKSWKLIKD